MAKFFLPLFLLALFLHGSTAQFGFGSNPWQSSRHGAQSQCRFERLGALEPKRRVKSEGGVTEYFDNNNEQLKCTGLAAIRRTIQPQGLALPSYFNAPHLIYILKGRGVAGAVIPGCPETFQSSGQQQQQQGQKQHGEQQQQGQKQQGEQQQQKHQGEQQQQGQKQQGEQQQQKHQGEQRQQGQKQQGEQQQQGQKQQQTGDQHQRILQFRQGDILAIPAGMVHWCYNDGDSPVVAVTVLDTSNSANQLDNNPRKFSLAGQDESSSNNVFRGFGLQFLADALGVSRELTRKLQQGQKGEIVKVQRGLRMVMPPRSEREEKQEEESEGRQEEKGQSEERQKEKEKEKGGQSNGLEQAFCTLRFTENIDKPSRADVYNPQAGRYTYLNGQKLPILNFIQMSAARGVLYKGATIVPHWNINAHSFIYVTGGRGRIQIVGDQGRSVFDDEISEGQMVVVPQHFAAMMQAREQQFEWVSFKTNGNAIANQIVGPGSFFRGLPEDVIAESYKGISRGEARNLKDQDYLLVPPRSSQQGGRAEA